MTGHPDALALSMYADGELPPERVADVERHLATCGDCRAEVARVQAFSRQLRRLSSRPMPESFQLDAEALVAGRPQSPAAATGPAPVGGGRLLRPRWARWAPHIYKVSAAAILALVAWRSMCGGWPSLAMCTGAPPEVTTQTPTPGLSATSVAVGTAKTPRGGGGDDPSLTVTVTTPTATPDDATIAAASCPSDSQVTMTVSEAQGMSEAEILARLFSDYLQRHVDASVPRSCRLKEYRIEGAESGSIWFSVLPESPTSDWWAGNGGPGESGWIVDKFLFVKTERRGDVYAMQIWGTGP